MMFSIDVVSAPTFRYPETPMWDQPLAELRSYDENLVKPLVLFADKITLRSEREDMLSLIVSSAFSVSRMPMRRVMRYAGCSARKDLDLLAALGLSPDILADSVETQALLGSVESGKADDSLLDGLRQFEKQHLSQINEFSNAYLTVLRQRRNALTSPNMTGLMDAGILEVTGWSTTEQTPFELAWQEELEFLTGNILDVERYLETSQGAVMLEPGSQFILGSSSKTPVKSESPASLTSRLASSFIGKLPGLESASLDELIDVREDLKEYLIPFRASMSAMANDVSSSGGETPEALVHEIERRWVEEVSPVIHEMSVKTRRGGYPRQLLNVLTEDKTSLASSAASIALAAGSVAAGLSTLIPAAAAAAYPFAKAMKETLREREAQEDNRLYFLYEANRRLGQG